MMMNMMMTKLQSSIMRIRKSKRQTTDGNEKCTTFRISTITQNPLLRYSSSRLPFQDRKNKPPNLTSSKSILKLSTKRTITQSSRLVRHPSVALQALHKLVRMNSSEYTELIICEIDKSKRRRLVRQFNLAQTLASIFNLSERMHQQVYSYRQVEADIKELHSYVKKLGSNTFTYRAFAFSGFVLFEYGSYSLSLYYFDRALKSFYDRDIVYSFDSQRKLEIQIYKFVCRIFLIKGRYNQAKNFAYKLLRKAWFIQNIDEEMTAYDILGKIYMELQSMTMCQYFHWRMSSGQKESPQILAMSKQEIMTETHKKMEFVCYETINIFVEKDAHFNDILENHYRVRSLQHAQNTDKSDLDGRTVFVYTHHSPNRELKNYHVLERKMIQAKESKELHFIRPKDSHRIKKLFTDFSALIHELTQKINTTIHNTEFSIAEETPLPSDL